MNIDANLTELLKEAVAKFNAMTPDEVAAMVRVQREGYVQAELSWPKPKFEMVNGVKVYASYEDYCNS